MAQGGERAMKYWIEVLEIADSSERLDCQSSQEFYKRGREGLKALSYKGMCALSCGWRKKKARDECDEVRRDVERAMVVVDKQSSAAQRRTVRSLERKRKPPEH